LNSEEFHKLVIERIKGFSDAMFAIVITIEVLQLRLHNAVHSNEELGQELLALWPIYVSFIVSVVLTASYWKMNSYVIGRVARTTRNLLWIMVVFLCLISLIPLASDILGKYPQLIISPCIFNGLLVLVSLIHYLLWLRINFRNNLTSGPLKPVTYVVAFLRINCTVVVYLISFGVAFANTYASIGISMLVPVVEVAAAFHLDIYLWTAKLIVLIYEKCSGTVTKSNKSDSSKNTVESEAKQPEKECNEEEEMEKDV